MRKILTAAVVLPIAALLLIFVLANRGPAVVSVDPFTPGTPGWSVQLPLFIVIFVAVIVGIVVGAAANWISQSRYRREARHQRHEAHRLEQELADLRRTQMPPAENLPAPYMSDTP